MMFAQVALLSLRRFYTSARDAEVNFSKPLCYYIVMGSGGLRGVLTGLQPGTPNI